MNAERHAVHVGLAADWWGTSPAELQAEILDTLAEVGAEREGERVTAVRAHTSGHDTLFHARWVVLATGGLGSGAIELDSDWRPREKVLGLPREERYYFDDDQSWEREIDDFVECVVTGREVVSGTSMDAYRAMELVARVYADGGRA